MKREEVHDALETIAGRELPDDLHVWTRIRAKIPMKNALTAQPWLPITRLVWIAALVVLLLLGVTDTYALDSLFLRVRQLSSPLDASYMADHGQALNLKQTRDDVTVTLERVYADAQRLVIGYQIESASDVEVGNVSLTSADGSVFRLVMVIGGDARSMIFVREQTTTTVRGLSKLQLTMKVRTDEFSTGSARLSQFTFDFEAAIEPQRVLKPALTSENAGVGITLQEVTVFAAEIRAVMCFSRSAPVPPWEITATLDLGTDSFAPLTAAEATSQPNCYAYTFAMGETPPRGQWTLRLTDLVDVTTREHIQGLWTFRFFMEVSPAS